MQLGVLRKRFLQKHPSQGPREQNKNWSCPKNTHWSLWKCISVFGHMQEHANMRLHVARRLYVLSKTYVGYWIHLKKRKHLSNPINITTCFQKPNIALPKSQPCFVRSMYSCAVPQYNRAFVVFPNRYTALSKTFHRNDITTNKRNTIQNNIANNIEDPFQAAAYSMKWGCKTTFNHLEFFFEGLDLKTLKTSGWPTTVKVYGAIWTIDLPGFWSCPGNYVLYTFVHCNS